MNSLRDGMKRATIIVMLVLTASFILPVSGNVTEIKAKSFTVKMNYSVITMTKGYSMKLKVTGTKHKVKWISSNKKIATVSKKGKVKGKKAGKCTVIAKVCGVKLKCKVKVKPLKTEQKKKTACTSSTLNLDTLKIDVDNGTYALKLLNNNKPVTWKTSNSEVAIVKDGNVTGISEGKCTITATADGKKHQCDVVVTNWKDAEIIKKQHDIYSMLGMINIDRVKAKVAPLKLDEDLNKAAEIRAREISKDFSHTRINNTLYSTVYHDIGLKIGSHIGENIAFASDIIENADALVRDAYSGLYASKGHRENMLNPNYEYIGVGTYTKTYKEDGWVYVDTYYAQEFYTK